MLVALLGLLSFFITSRSDIETTVLKVPGQLYNNTDDGRISNLYNIQFVNKTFDAKVINVEVEDRFNAVLEKVGEGSIEVPPNDLYEGVFFIKIPKENITQMKNNITLKVYSNGELIDEVETKFLGPVSNLK